MTPVYRRSSLEWPGNSFYSGLMCLTAAFAAIADWPKPVTIKLRALHRRNVAGGEDAWQVRLHEPVDPVMPLVGQLQASLQQWSQRRVEP